MDLHRIYKNIYRPDFVMPVPLSDRYSELEFFNNLDFMIKFQSILVKQKHAMKELSGWKGITSYTCLGVDGTLYDIDIRHAWGKEIFKQNLFDFGWSDQSLFYQKLRGEPDRQKIVIYLCEKTSGLVGAFKIDKVQNHYNVGTYWKSVCHIYIQLPVNLPFELSHSRNIVDISEEIMAFGDFATTRSLIKEKNEEIRRECTNHPAFSNSLNTEKRNSGGLRKRGYIKKRNENNAVISVITVVYNGERYLEQAIQSIINQDYSNIEYIIIDGGSTDSSLDIIRKYNDQIDYWISEPDQGIYPAMNKGVAVATGCHIVHINADDLLLYSHAIPGEIDENINYLFKTYAEIEKGKYCLYDIAVFHGSDYYKNTYYSPVKHQSFLSINNNRSYFKTGYKIISDSMLIAEKLKHENYLVKDQVFSLYRVGGFSSNNLKYLYRDRLIQLIEYKKISLLFYYIRWILYIILRGLFKIIGLVKLKRWLLN